MFKNAYKLIYGELFQLKKPNLPLLEKEDRSNIKSINNTLDEEKDHDYSIKVYNNFSDWDSLVKVINSCNLCELSQNRKKQFIEFGNKNATWFFIGDNLSRETYDLFIRMIENFQLNSKKDIYYTNATKCPEFINQRASIKQLNLCKNYLFNQIDLVKPKVIIIMGYHILPIFFDQNLEINKSEVTMSYYNKTPVLITFDLDFLIRNKEERKRTWDTLIYAKKQISV